MQLGDKVQHKSGGPIMVIISSNTHIKDFSGNPVPFKWVTRWWDMVRNNFESASFDELELVKID